MKRTVRKVLSAALAAALALCVSAGAAAVPVFAAEGFTLQRESERIIDDQLALYSRKLRASDGSLLAENYYVYEPGSFIRPIAAFGNDIRGAAGYSVAMEIEESAGWKVIGGSNADFFNMSTGVALGAVVRDGIVCSSENMNWECVGFDKSGQARIGRMELNVSLLDVDQNRYFNNLSFNKSLEKNSGLVLYSGRFGSGTAASGKTLNALILIEDGEARIGQTVRGKIESVFYSDEAVALDSSHLLLSVYAGTVYQSILPVVESLAEGDAIELSFTAGEGWDGMMTVVGAERRLIRGGVPETFTEGGKAPRTALGIKEDGSVILYTADGRDNAHSAGLSYSQLAQRLLDLGAAEAVNLDGGGSTQLHIVWPGYVNDNLVNKPSENRRCGNYLMFVVPKAAAGQAERLYLYRSDEYVLAGSSVKLTAKAADHSFNAVDLPGSLSYDVPSDLGSMDGGNFVTVPGADGVALITAYSGSLSADTEINVIGSPDSINVLDAGGKPVSGTLKLSPGETVQLGASAAYKGLPIKADPACFSWTVDGGAGAVTSSGRFTAVQDQSAKGTITVSAGNATATVNVVIDKAAPVVECLIDDINLIASVYDGVDGVVAGSRISAAIDGAKLETSYDPESGRLYAQLPDDGLLHHIVIEAGDSGDNWSRTSVEYAAPGFSCGSVFADMPDTHWATRYVEYMNRAGILNGRESGGAQIYDPSAGMTRQEFAAVMVRMLGVDASLYENADISFADDADISSWAVPSVKAAASLGIMNGKGSGDTLSFDPLGRITRQEVMTVIGRMQKGDKFGKAELSSFSDAPQVSDWALPYVQSLVAQKIITGSNGKLNPLSPVSRAEVAKIIFECR